MNEHFSGRLRHYLPERTSFDDVTQQKLGEYLTEINNRPSGLLRGFRTAELVDSFMLPGLAVDNHSGLRWGVGNRALSAGVDCCRTPRYSG